MIAFRGQKRVGPRPGWSPLGVYSKFPTIIHAPFIWESRPGYNLYNVLYRLCLVSRKGPTGENNKLLTSYFFLSFENRGNRGNGRESLTTGTKDGFEEMERLSVWSTPSRNTF